MNIADASSPASGLPLRPCRGTGKQECYRRTLPLPAALAGILILGATAARAQTPPDMTVSLTAHTAAATCTNRGPDAPRTRQGAYRLLEGEALVLAISPTVSPSSPLSGSTPAAMAARAVTGVTGAVSIDLDATVMANDFTFTSTNLMLAGGSIGLRSGDVSRADYRISSIEDCLLVRVQAANDNIPDAGERLRLQLLNTGTGADRITVLGRDGSPMPVTAGLADPNPVIEIVIEEPVRYAARAEQTTVEEDRNDDTRGNEIVFVVEIQSSGPAPVENTTLYYRLSGTATPGMASQDARDYTAPADATFPTGAGDGTAVGTLTFLRGSRSPQRLRLPARADNLDEADETIILHLYREPPGAEGSFVGVPIAATTTATLTDNDQVTASVTRSPGAPATINEGEDARFTVTLSGGRLSQDTMVAYSISGDVGAADYDDPNAGMLTFSSAASSSDTASLPLDIRALADGTQEADAEDLTIELTGVSTLTAGGGLISTSQANATVTIRASTAADHIVSVRAPTASQSEGATATFNIEVPPNVLVVRTNQVRVNYRLSGTAIGGQDYTQPSGTATIPLINNVESVNIPVTDDTLNENAETIVMTLVSATLLDAANMEIGGAGISAANSEATVQISANDPLTVSVARTDGSALLQEPAMGVPATAANQAVFTVSIAGGMSSAPVEVSFSISGAVDTTDYSVALSEGAGSRLDIPTGESSGTITVTAAPDTLNEPDEMFTLTLMGATSADMVSVPPVGATATASIAASGATLAVAVASGAAMVTEGANIEFFVTLTARSANDVSVMYTARTNMPNPTTPGILPDLDTAMGTLSIPAGQRGGRIRIHVRQDRLEELTQEILTLTLTGATRVTGEDPPPSVPINTATATATIPENAAHVRTVRVTLPDTVAEGAAAAFRFDVAPLAQSTLPHTVALRVCYNLVDGTAVGGLRDAATADYIFPAEGTCAGNPAAVPPIPPSSYSAVIPAGNRAASVRIETVNDNAAEPDETFTLRINEVLETDPVTGAPVATPDPTGATAPDPDMGSAMATIADDDGVRISLSGPGRVAEGESAAIAVRLGGGTRTGDVTVMYAVTLEDGDIVGARTLPAVAGDVATASGTLTFTTDETVKNFRLTPAEDTVPEPADNDFIVITLSNNIPVATTNIGAPNPLRIRITDEADDPRLRTQRLEVAGAALTRAAMLLALPTISRRLDPGSGPSAPGLTLTVDGRQVVAGGGTEGVAPAPFTGIGIVMPADGPTLRQLLNMPEDGTDDDGIAALQGLEGIAIAVAQDGGSLSLRQLLGTSDFALAQGAGGTRTGTVVWGRGGYTKLEGEPEIGGETANYKGDAWTFYIGADRRYGNFLIGLATGYTYGDVELDADILPGLPGTSTFEQEIFSILPYAAWQPSPAVSIWALGGYGRGDVDITEVEAAGLRRTGNSDAELWLGGAGLTLRRPSQTPVDMLLRLSTTAAQGTIEGGRLTGDGAVAYGESKTNTQQVHAEFELAARFGAMEGTWVRPFLLLGAAQDFGDAAPDAVTGELGGGFDLQWPRLGLESNLKAQARITNKDGQVSRRKYKEYVLTGALRYDLGNDRRGLLLSLQPEFGAAADKILGGAAATSAGAGALQRSLRRSLHGELAYGIGNARFWGAPGIVTIYGNGDISGRQRQYGSGLRFESQRFTLSAGARRARRNDSRPGYEFLLDGEYSF